MEFKAYRNLRLCTKDCLCLYVCPYGATDTEDSIIDINKCVGCGVCAKACPSGAISLVPVELPVQQPKADEVKAVLNKLTQSKSDGEVMARQIADQTDQNGLKRLMDAIARSERLIAEDIEREAGFMLPQSGNSHELLEVLIDNPPTSDFPIDVAQKLLELVPNNEKDSIKGKGDKTMTKWRCTVCGYI
ncbi:MAG: 4Fe-4S binding protein, partial [Butyrivibrio sp.]|nr:4Fe-4S binding protein [Butyrivibrio sp.]